MKFGKISAVAAAMALFTVSHQPANAFVGQAAPAAKVKTVSDVQEVRHRRGHRSRAFRRGYRKGLRRGIRRGYRRNRGRYIAGGLIAGAVIGSAIAAPRYYARPRYYAPRYRYRPVRLGRSHVNWCYNRYRSYRAYDNTFQPYSGPRRQCWSPYN